MAPQLPRRGDREKERETRYTDWEGIQPLSAADTERAFDYENDWNRRFRALRADPAARDRIREGLVRLERSMAIETGVIEGLYNPTHDVTQTLLREGFRAEHVRRQGVDVEPEHLVTVLDDHVAAAEMVYAFIREDRPVTKHALRELHAQITAHQETHNAVDMLGRRVQRTLRRGCGRTSPTTRRGPTAPSTSTRRRSRWTASWISCWIFTETTKRISIRCRRGPGSTTASSRFILSRTATGARAACS